MLNQLSILVTVIKNSRFIVGADGPFFRFGRMTDIGIGLYDIVRLQGFDQVKFIGEAQWVIMKYLFHRGPVRVQIRMIGRVVIIQHQCIIEIILFPVDVQRKLGMKDIRLELVVLRLIIPDGVAG